MARYNTTPNRIFLIGTLLFAILLLVSILLLIADNTKTKLLLPPKKDTDPITYITKYHAKIQRNPSYQTSQLQPHPIRHITAPGAIIYAIPADQVDEGEKDNKQFSGQILWGRNIHQSRSMASLTKIMTSLLTQEIWKKYQLDPKRNYQIPLAGTSSARPHDASVAGLKHASSHSWKDLLSYLIVSSANDAAYALAIWTTKQYWRVAETRQNQHTFSTSHQKNLKFTDPEYIAQFVQSMQKKAELLKLHSANFTDPDGWSEHNTISPFDMARLAAYYLQHFPQSTQWHRKKQVQLPRENQIYWKQNTNKLLTFYPEIEGLKTGFTYEAGFNFCAIARRGKWRYIAVVMGIQNDQIAQGVIRRAAEAETMLNWAMVNFTPLFQHNSYRIEKNKKQDTALFTNKNAYFHLLLPFIFQNDMNIQKFKNQLVYSPKNRNPLLVQEEIVDLKLQSQEEYLFQYTFSEENLLQVIWPRASQLTEKNKENPLKEAIGYASLHMNTRHNQWQQLKVVQIDARQWNSEQPEAISQAEFVIPGISRLFNKTLSLKWELFLLRLRWDFTPYFWPILQAISLQESKSPFGIEKLQFRIKSQHTKSKRK